MKPYGLVVALQTETLIGGRNSATPRSKVERAQGDGGPARPLHQPQRDQLKHGILQLRPSLFKIGSNSRQGEWRFSPPPEAGQSLPDSDKL